MRDPIKHYNKASGHLAIEIIAQVRELPELKQDLEIQGFSYVVLDDPDNEEQIEVSVFYQGPTGFLKLLNIFRRWEVSLKE